MKTYLRLLSFSRPIGSFAFPYLLFSVLGILFGLMNFTLLIPILDVLFGKSGKSHIPAALPSFELSGDYFVALFNFKVGEIIQQDGELGALQFVCLVLIVSVFFSNLFKYFAQMMIETLRQRTIRNIRRTVFEHTIKLHVGFFSENRKGDIMSRIISDVYEIEGSVTGTLNVIVKEPVTLIFCLWLLISISVKLTLFTLIILPVSGGLIGFITRQLRKDAADTQLSMGRLVTIIDETLSSLKVINVFNGNKYTRDKFDSENVFYTKAQRRFANRREFASPFSEFTGSLIIACMLIYGGTLVLGDKPEMEASAFIGYVVLFSQLLKPAKAISSAWINVQRGLAAGARVFEIMDTEPAIKDLPDAVELTAFKHSIEFRNVSFSYGEKRVLENVSFVLNRGETLALVGPSGAGKSTIADLLPRFYEPDEGEILIDGKNIRSYTLESLRRFLGIVTQESILYNDTIYNNIAFSKTDAERNEVENAAKVANAHEFIVHTDQGYETIIGDRGVKLSGGQRQRLNIARAVLKNPDILILDEATSALDTESEKLVQDSLTGLMKNRTSIVIAHRLSTIQHADVILVLDRGKLKEQGTHDELLAKENGLYRRLNAMQQV